MNDFESIKKRTEKAEEEVQALTELFDKLKSAVHNGTDLNAISFPNGIECPNDQLSELITENTKLKHRLAILKRALKEEKERFSGHTMENILDSLTQLFISAVARAYPDVPDPPVPLTTSSSPQFGDYQCNAAMPIAQLLKAQGIKVSPRDVATQIKDNLESSELIEKIEIAGPGFLNVWISRKYCQGLLTKIVTKGVLPPPQPRKLKVVIDFSSPNIAKEMHVGHLRSTIIGDSIARLLEYLGHDVERVNHIGDWGTQFGMLIAHLQDKYPNYKTESPPLSTLMHFYKEAKVRFDTDESFKKRAYESVVQLQAGNPEFTQAWQLICDVSRRENQLVYDRLDIRLTERGESFYQSRMETLVKELKERGLLEEDEKRYIMWGKNKDLIPFTIVKSDGGFTYDTSDMATIRYRIEECKADWIIYVVDMGQATHFTVLSGCAERAGWLDPSKVRVDFVGFGVVLGEDKKKFKTRSGESVRLVELLDEGLKKALETLKAKGRDQVLTEEELREAQEAVAYGCIKYADLSHNRVNDYVFSFDKMLEDKGNTAVYLLYAYTRICSIARNANISVTELEQAANTTPVAITHEKEWKLAKVLLRFPEVLTKITRDLYVHTLCEFLYEIACTFTEFYDCCYCIEKDSASGDIKKIHMDRLLLTEATARVMKQCFNILGLKTGDQRECEKPPGETQENIVDTLRRMFKEALVSAYPDLPDPPVNIINPPHSKHWDYQCTSAMPIVQMYRGRGVDLKPWDVAQRIKEYVKIRDVLARVEVSKPGFLNIFINRKYCQNLLKTILLKGVLPPPQECKRKVVVDFSSPNIAKEMHVGHLRSTIIGDSLARLLEFLGHDVERVSHVGDWGTQFGMLIAHIQDEEIYKNMESVSLATLNSLYKEAKLRFDLERPFRKKAHECVQRLQDGEPEVTKIWWQICDISRRDNQVIYERLGIRLTERGESFYHSRMEKMVKELKEKGLLDKDKSRLIMWGKEKELIPFTISKFNGSFTYDTSDLATIKYRIEESKADWIIYVVDNGQSTHFKVLKSCAERAGWLDPTKVRMDYVGFGVVLGEDKKKLKSRFGETVRLVDLLDEGLKKALATLKAKKRDTELTEEELKEAQEAVAYGCIKYADLSHNRDRDYVFSFDKMLKDKGNTAVYLLYAYTRICSIARNANISVAELEQAANTTPVATTLKKEWRLAKTLLRFPEIVAQTSRGWHFNFICDFLYEVACTFSEFYNSCYCIETKKGKIKINMDRLLLAEATARVMKQCFDILGLKTVSRM